MPRVDKRIIVVLLVGLALFAWFLSGLHWEELTEALLGVRPEWLLVACALIMGDYVFRSIRWLVVVRHVDRNVRLRTLWKATAIGSALNTFLPLRGGDLVRPAVVAHERKVPFTTLLSTTVLERLLDAFGLVAALIGVVWLLPPETASAGGILAELKDWGYASAAFAVVGLGLVLWMITRQARALMMRILRPFPRRARMRVMRTYLQLAHGLEAAGSPLRLVPALLATVAIWTFTTLAIQATFRAIGLDLPPAMALFVAVALTASVSVPQAPGYLGLFQVVMEHAVRLWGAPEALAEAGSFVLWFVYIGPITLVGMTLAAFEGQGFFRFRRMLLDEAEEETRRKAAV